MQIAVCIGCDCDDLHACYDMKHDRPCSWLKVDYSRAVGVCSACEEHLTRWESEYQAPEPHYGSCKDIENEYRKN